MLNLTGAEYRPELAEGYMWRFDLSETSSHIFVTVRRAGTITTVYETFVEISLDDTAESIRAKLLKETKAVASMIRPWNPEYAPMAISVVHSLIPPKDAPADGPRTSGDLKLNLPRFK